MTLEFAHVILHTYNFMDAAGNTTEYFYCHEQLTGVRFPDGSTRAAGFDNLNRQIWAVDERGVAVTNAYDKLDRLIASAYVPYEGASTVDDLPDVTSVPASLSPTTCNWSLIYGGFADQRLTNAYDCVGNLLGTRDWVGTINHSYDALNRRLSEAVEYSSSPYLEYSLALSYDPADNVVTQDFDSDDLVVQTTYTYDGLNRLSSVNAAPDGLPIRATYSYRDNGKLYLKRYLESGSEKAHQLYSYDNENRLSGISYGALCSVTYNYNFAQQISSMNETIAGTERRFVYEYDQRDQLTEETEWLPDEIDWLEGPPNTYTYDHAQNRATAVKSGQSIYETYGYSIANKMTNIWRGSQSASSRYWYDLAGNLSTSIVGYATNCYHYNVQNKLVKIVGTNFVHEFKYNSRSERIAVGTSISGATMTWRYDACQGPVTLAEFDASAAMTRWYVRGLGVAQGIGDVVAEVDVTGSPKAHYYLCNHRGDTLVVLNPDGADNSTFRYDAFGKCYAATGPFTPRFTFSTKEFLPQAQLYLYQHRLYDVVAGRWTQRDPIDYQDSPNLYQYCTNNPMNREDADGRAVNDVERVEQPASNAQNAESQTSTTKESPAAVQDPPKPTVLVAGIKTIVDMSKPGNPHIDIWWKGVQYRFNGKGELVDCAGRAIKSLGRGAREAWNYLKHTKASTIQRLNNAAGTAASDIMKARIPLIIIINPMLIDPERYTPRQDYMGKGQVIRI